MKLYRNISCKELVALYNKGVIYGKFSTESDNNTYKESMGPVICCFLTPRKMDRRLGYDDNILIEIEVPEERIIYASGTYLSIDEYDGMTEILTLKEAYLSYYTLEEVTVYATEKSYNDDGENSILEKIHFKNRLLSIRWSFLADKGGKKEQEEYLLSRYGTSCSLEEVQLAVDLFSYRERLNKIPYIMNTSLASAFTYLVDESKGNDVLSYSVEYWNAG